MSFWNVSDSKVCVGLECKTAAADWLLHANAQLLVWRCLSRLLREQVMLLQPPQPLLTGWAFGCMMLQGQLDLCSRLLSRPLFTPVSAECAEGHACVCTMQLLCPLSWW